MKRHFVNKVLQFFQAVSGDVLVGAFAMGIYAVYLLDVKPVFEWWLVLMLSVWAVYTADHLIDGFSRKNEAAIYRHRLHYRFHYFLFGLELAVIVAAVVLAFYYLDDKILRGGIVMGILVFIYFLMVYLGRQKSFYFHKEFFIAIFYVTGIWLAPLIWFQKPLTLYYFGIITGFVILAWTESILIALFDMENDKHDGHPSFITFYGSVSSKKFVKILLQAHFILMIILLFKCDEQKKYVAVTIQLLMNGLIFLLSVFEERLKKTSYYKMLGEMIFWLPAVMVL